MNITIPHQARTVDATRGSSTIVQLTNAGIGAIPLIVTLFGTSSGAAPVQHVAAYQSVSTNVRIDFEMQTTLVWSASLAHDGWLSPNSATRPFTRSTDSFRLKLGDGIELSHDAEGWKIPAYDSWRYSVKVGFALQIHCSTYWALSVLCAPQQLVRVTADGYALARNDGALQLGDPVNSHQGWHLSIGNLYNLDFDARGTGTLEQFSTPWSRIDKPRSKA
jgi:hypothetical protein